MPNPVFYNDFDSDACEWLRNLMDSGDILDGVVDDRSITLLTPDDCERTSHFFAGIGGWPLALGMAGWPDDLPVWTASLPCQPFSSAGKRRGTDDERHLWPAFRGLVSKCKPPVIFGEQVASSEVVGTRREADFALAVYDGEFARANKLAKQLITSKSFHYHPRWLDRVRADLEAEGYTFEWDVLGAHSVGAPHIRQRIFWVAYAKHWWQGERNGGQEASRLGWCGSANDSGISIGVGDSNGGSSDERECDAKRKKETRTAFDWSGKGVRLIRCVEPTRYGGTVEKFRRCPVEPGLFPLAYGVSGSLVVSHAGVESISEEKEVETRIVSRNAAIKGSGNAIVPQVAAQFIGSFMRFHKIDQRDEVLVG